jgi:hypothetical protein
MKESSTANPLLWAANDEGTTALTVNEANDESEPEVEGDAADWLHPSSFFAIRM